jgi:hypothetical protein
MKALYIHDQKEEALVLYGHDLDDELVQALVEEFQAQGKHAFAVDQLGLHGGPAEVCEKCRHAGEKIAGGTMTAYQYPAEEETASTLNGAIGMVSAELAQSTSSLTKLGKPIRVLFSLLPYLAALALIAYGMSYLLRSESGQTGDNFNPSLVLAQRTPTQTRPAPTDIPSPTATIPTPSPTVLPTPTTSEPTPTEEPTAVAAPACLDALSITPADAGQIMCITGVVYRAETNNGVFMITFSKDWGNFYLLSYNREWKEAQAGVCIQVTGEIEMLGTIPVIAFGYQNELSLCP